MIKLFKYKEFAGTRTLCVQLLWYPFTPCLLLHLCSQCLCVWEREREREREEREHLCVSIYIIKKREPAFSPSRPLHCSVLIKPLLPVGCERRNQEDGEMVRRAGYFSGNYLTTIHKVHRASSPPSTSLCCCQLSRLSVVAFKPKRP